VRRTPSAIFIAVVAVLAGCTEPRPCDRLPSPAQTTGQASPSAGDGLVPLDTMVWLRIDGPYADGSCLTGDVELVALADGPIPVEPVLQVGAPARTLIGWRPTEALAPSSDYELRWTVGNLDSGVVSFRTGVAAAPMPAVPTPLRWAAQLDGPSLGTNAAELDDYDDYVEFEVDQGRFVLVATELPTGPDVPESVFRIGELGFVWSGEPLPVNEELQLRFSALDLAGNLSAWTDPVPWQVPGLNRSDEGSF